MAQEIEKKYFVDKLNNELYKRRLYAAVRYIEQYYLLIQNNCEMRIRKTCLKSPLPTGDNYIYQLTHKFGTKHNRKEIEIDITSDEYQSLKPSKDVDCIRKYRSTTTWNGFIIEVDAFKDYDFYIAEIEFDSEEEYKNFKPPEFLQCSDGVIRDVSDIPEFKNSYLAQNLMTTEEYLENLEVGKDS